jgi:hypothetical protein
MPAMKARVTGAAIERSGKKPCAYCDLKAVYRLELLPSHEIVFACLTHKEELAK